MQTKICTKCGKELPATNEYYHSYKRSPDGLKPNCKDCRKLTAKEYYKDNKEHILSKSSEYYKKNKSDVLTRQKVYRENNSEKISRYQKKYYENEANKENHKQWQKKWDANNKDKRRAIAQKYYNENSEKERLRRHRRRAHKMSLSNGLRQSEWLFSKIFFNHKCAYCGEITKLTQDHFWPFNHGGEYTKLNIIPACGSCNSSKRDKPFEEWYPTHKSYSPEREAKIYEYFANLALENGGWGRRRYDLGTLTIIINEQQAI